MITLLKYSEKISGPEPSFQNKFSDRGHVGFLQGRALQGLVLKGHLAARPGYYPQKKSLKNTGGVRFSCFQVFSGIGPGFLG